MNLRVDTFDRQKLAAVVVVTAAALAVGGSALLMHPSAAADKANLKKQRAAAGMPDMEAMRAKMLDRTAAELSLTASQKEQFQAAQEQAETARQELFTNKSLSREQIGQRMQQARTEDEARLRAILTPEQQTKYDQMQEKRRAEWAKRREQGPAGRGFRRAAVAGHHPSAARWVALRQTECRPEGREE